MSSVNHDNDLDHAHKLARQPFMALKPHYLQLLLDTPELSRDIIGDKAHGALRTLVDMLMLAQAREASARAKALHYPRTPQEISDFLGNNFISMRKGNMEGVIDENSVYQLSVHDLQEAFEHWRYFSGNTELEEMESHAERWLHVRGVMDEKDARHLNRVALHALESGVWPVNDDAAAGRIDRVIDDGLEAICGTSGS